MKIKHSLRQTLLLLILTISLVPSKAQFVEYVLYIDEDQTSDAERPNSNHNRNIIDLEISHNLFSIAPNALWPESQLECFPISAAFDMIGNDVAINTKLSIYIEDMATQNSLHTDTLYFGDIDSSTQIDFQLMDCFTPPNLLANYEATYKIESDCTDPDPLNNEKLFSFETTEYTFAKENGATNAISPQPGNWDEGETHSWAYGNYYYLVNPVSSNKLRAVFGIGNASDPDIPGRIITLKLYKWENDLNTDTNLDPDERELVALGQYFIQGTETYTDLLSVPLLEPITFDSTINIDLEGETAYVLMLEYSTPDFEDLLIPISEEYDYSLYVYLNNLIETPRYGPMLGIGGDLTQQPYYSLGFGMDKVPVVRLGIEEGEEPVSNQNLTFSSNKTLDISPNPVRSELNITIPKEFNSREGKLSIFNQLGQKMMDLDINAQNSSQIRLDVSHLANGVYFVSFKSIETALSGAFIVNK